MQGLCHDRHHPCINIRSKLSPTDYLLLPMIIIRNRFLPPTPHHIAINLFGILFVKRNAHLTPALINHERIHTAQMRELIFIFFYILYIAEWLFRLVLCRGDYMSAYRNTSFEREAYLHDHNLSYLSKRPAFAQWRKT